MAPEVISHVILYVPRDGVRSVQAIGTFTQPGVYTRVPLVRTADRSFLTMIPLPPGVYEYKLIVDKVLTCDPNAPTVTAAATDAAIAAALGPKFTRDPVHIGICNVVSLQRHATRVRTPSPPPLTSTGPDPAAAAADAAAQERLRFFGLVGSGAGPADDGGGWCTTPFAFTESKKFPPAVPPHLRYTPLNTPRTTRRGGPAEVAPEAAAGGGGWSFRRGWRCCLCRCT